MGFSQLCNSERSPIAAVLCPVGSSPGVRGFEAAFLLLPSGVTLGEFLSLSSFSLTVDIKDVDGGLGRICQGVQTVMPPQFPLSDVLKSCWSSDF